MQGAGLYKTVVKNINTTNDQMIYSVGVLDQIKWNYRGNISGILNELGFVGLMYTFKLLVLVTCDRAHL